MNYKEIVEHILSVTARTRDGDQELYKEVLFALNFNTLKQSALSLIMKVKFKELPSLDTITRLRRKAQMDNPNLRGDLWNDRHGIKVEKALSDLGYSQPAY